MNKKSLLVSIYGVTDHNLHAKLLVRTLSKKFVDKEGRKIKVEQVNYPVYDLSPLSQRIKNYLEHNNPDRLTPLQFQELNVANKVSFEPKLKQLLLENDIVVTKMYIGTSIACGMADGISKSIMRNLNAGLIEPDISIFLNTSDFSKSLEKGHVFKGTPEKLEKVYRAHLELARQFGWRIVGKRLKDATEDKSLDEVNDEIANIVYRRLARRQMALV